MIFSGWNGGYGNLLTIAHADGVLSTRYGHLATLEARVGDVVKRGEVVGTVGTTGKSTGPHLHFEVRRDGQATDPFDFIADDFW